MREDYNHFAPLNFVEKSCVRPNHLVTNKIGMSLIVLGIAFLLPALLSI